MKIKNFRFRKTLLLAATACGVAHSALAQTNVSVTGAIDMYAGSMRYAGDPGSRSVVNSGGMSTSWLGFHGSEDLGGGLKANVALHAFLQADTGAQGRFPGDTLWSRAASIGLSGSMGSVSFGRELAPHFLPTVLFNPFGDSHTFAPLLLHADIPLFNASGWSNSIVGDTGWSNSIRYATPDFGGLSANVHYQFGEAAGNNGVNNMGVNAFYFAGPLALTAFHHSVEVNNPLHAPGAPVQLNATRQKAWMLGGSYDFGRLKLFATWGQTAHNVDLEDKTLSLGKVVPLGAGRLQAGWAQTKRSGAAAGAERTRRTASIGYDHDLSKRTDVYAVFMNDRITGQDSGNSLGVGIRHRF